MNSANQKGSAFEVLDIQSRKNLYLLRFTGLPKVNKVDQYQILGPSHGVKIEGLKLYIICGN